MSGKPIGYSGPMVRAMLADIKTQTRRLFKPRGFEFSTHPVSGDRYNQYRPYRDGSWDESRIVGSGPMEAFGWGESLYGYLSHAPGDRLYVREHWRVSRNYDGLAPRDLKPRSMTVLFEAGGSIANQASGKWEPSDYEPAPESAGWAGRFRQGMHMPRWASRITLTVTDVRVQRLQEISEEDAIAEGIEDVTAEIASSDGSLRFWKRYRDGGWNGYVDSPIASYASLWTEINGPGSWEANPWVAAYSFTVERGNIDATRPGLAGEGGR